jgi:DNA-binding response OmpR family regulator
LVGVRLKLLVVEDETRMVELLRKGLAEEGHTVVCAVDGTEGLDLARNYEFDVIILDIMLPRLNGYDLAHQLRREKVTTPVLMLTAKDSVPDLVRGLDAGADDYLTKPFAFEELLARLRAVKRRAPVPQATKLQVGDLVLDPATREVLRGGTDIMLTRTEYNLLERLMYRSGKVVPRRSLIEAVWGFDRDIEENTLDAFVRLLRTKIDTDRQPKLIHTVRGVGYMIRSEAQS